MKKSDDGYYCLQIIKVVAIFFLIVAGYGAYIGAI